MTETSIAITILLGLFLLLLLLKVPVAFSLAIATFATAAYLDIPAMVVTQQMVKSSNSFSLVAIPFFIVMGSIMGAGGVSDKLVDFSDVLVGRFRGGLAKVNILSSMFFGGISGSAVADVSSVGAVMIPVQKKEGYPAEFSVSVTIASSIEGILIPPSHNMIIYSVAAGGLSVARMFLAGLLPGFLLTVMLFIIVHFLSIKHDFPRGKKYTLKEGLITIKDSILALVTILIIMIGVAAGLFTATESAAIATIYAFFIVFFVYKEIPLSSMVGILSDSIRTLAIVFGLIATSGAFGWMMTYLRVPNMITEALIGITDNRIVILLIVNIILLFLGMIMDMAPLILIMTPILLPVVTRVGIDPIQFGIILMLNLGFGLLTPPVGSVLFVGCSIGGTTIEKQARDMVPFYVTIFVTLMLLNFVPGLTLWLPSMIL